MPHQPIQSQEEDNSKPYVQGNRYIPISRDSMAPPFPIGHYTDAAIYGGGYGMMPSVHNNLRQQLYYSNSVAIRDWNNSASNLSTMREYMESPSREQGKKSSNESDEEAAATALLMAAGPRSENVEMMQAAVRMKKQLMHKQNENREKSIPVPSSNTRNENDTRPSSPPAVIVKNFPHVLHDVLTTSEYAGTVLEWLSHGKSFRILRWDDLSDTVIPNYFPDLCVNNSDDKKLSSTEKMNMFIMQMKVWGFKEIRDIGPELGTFQHEFFIKIAPNLCKHMKTVTLSRKRRVESNVVSPSRKGPSRDYISSHSSVVDTPGKDITAGFRENPQTSFATDSPRRDLVQEYRQENNVGVSSPERRSGPRTFSFQEHFESPKSFKNEMQLNYVSPTSSDTIGITTQTPHLGLKSSRGGRGGQTAPRILDMGERLTSKRGGFPVSNRGRNVSTRGRSAKIARVRANVDESPMIIKNLEKRSSS